MDITQNYFSKVLISKDHHKPIELLDGIFGVVPIEIDGHLYCVVCQLPSREQTKATVIFSLAESS